MTASYLPRSGARCPGPPTGTEGGRANVSALVDCLEHKP